MTANEICQLTRKVSNMASQIDHSLSYSDYGHLSNGLCTYARPPLFVFNWPPAGLHYLRPLWNYMRTYIINLTNSRKNINKLRVKCYFFIEHQSYGTNLQTIYKFIQVFLKAYNFYAFSTGRIFKACAHDLRTALKLIILILIIKK